MNRRITYFLCLLISFQLITIDGIGQFWKRKKKNLPDQPFGFIMDDNNRSISIPFKVYSNLAVLQVKIDDTDSLNFILDTGVNSIFITDPKIAEKMGLEYIREVEIKGAGKEKHLMASVSINHTVHMDDITGYQQNIVVLSEDILELSEYMGVPIHGIFGHSLFENFVVSIDFGSMYINVHKPEKFKLKPRHGEVFPIIVTQNKPYIDNLQIIDETSPEPKKLNLVIDTGAGHALLLNADSDNVNLPSKTIRSNLGRGLNGEIFGEIGRVPVLKMGDIEVKDIIGSFPDSLAFSMKFPPTDADRQGSIGGELLRRFKVTFNYPEGYMALKPNKKKMKQPFEHDMSGLDIRAQKNNLETYYIKGVSPDSPAAMAGLLPGDELVFFNQESAATITLTEIYNILSKREGKKIHIIYRRNGQIGVAEFELKRVI
ncbi:aspartyl protease family protein [Jiulongibacter sp. NS-SX5]|uniref:aspartyl protease family protein n=1 Tax=Jiulongibacter sp. NS-SX5 TaxID=3463854 RepID=UPI00405902CC